MDIEYLLTSTRSVRRSLDLNARIDVDEVRECLRIGLQAPNGSNQQAWRWLIVTDAHLRQAIADFYREAYLSKVGGELIAKSMSSDTSEGKLMNSTEWLVENLAEVPAFVLPCYRPYLPPTDMDDSFSLATLYGSIFPAVWNFQLALHTRGYGTCITTLHLQHEATVREILGIPEGYIQGCLLPVGRLKADRRFRPAPRRPIEEVVGINGWDQPADDEQTRQQGQ